MASPDAALQLSIDSSPSVAYHHASFMKERQMIHATHTDTRTLVLDDDVRERLAARTSAPDENGCMLYREGVTTWAAHLEVASRDGELLAVSVLRVASALAGRPVPSTHEVVHSCYHTNNGIGLCVNPDHFDTMTARQAERERERRKHFAGLRATFPNRRTA